MARTFGSTTAYVAELWSLERFRKGQKNGSYEFECYFVNMIKIKVMTKFLDGVLL